MKMESILGWQYSNTNSDYIDQESIKEIIIKI